MFPSLHIVESLEPTDEKRDQEASTVGREHIPHSSKIQLDFTHLFTAHMWKVVY